MLTSLIPVTGLQLPLLIPSPFFLKCPFPHLSLCTVSQGHGERGCHPALPASGSFEIQGLKSGFFSSFVVLVQIPIAEEFLSALELWDEGSCQQLPWSAVVSSGCS